MSSDASNARRATPERVLWLFAAFAVLVAISAVRDCRARARHESAVPAMPAAD